jgi:excreted virulence factor EspC (type VII ESX diderm)
MDGVRAVTDALRGAAREMSEAAAAWQKSITAVRGATLGEDDYGLLGKDLVKSYAKTVTRIATELETGQKRISKAATDLDYVATGYENVDHSFYKKFGYTER